MNVDSVLLQASDSAVRRTTGNVRSQSSGDRDRLMEACRDFEALFLKQMLNTMRDTVEKSGLLDGGFAEQIYEDMLYDEYAKKMADTARFGIAEMLYNQMSAYL